MAPDASETLLAEFQQRSRRFRRRIRRLRKGQGQVPGDQNDDVVPPADPVPLEQAFNEAIQLGDAAADEVASDDEQGAVESDTWSHDRVDRGREMERLEQILLRENHEFHLHC